MKKSVLIVMIIMLSLVGMINIVQAEPAYVPVVPYIEGDNAVIPPLPAGAKLLNVQVYNDTTGMHRKNIGPVNSFSLKPGYSFNFTWEGKNQYQELDPGDVRDGRWWQLVTPMSKTGNGLAVACFPGGRDCKYLRPE